MRSLFRILVGLAIAVASSTALAAEPAPADSGAARAATVQDRIIEAAEGYLNEPYVFGGRDGRPGCRGAARCPEGIDCQSLIFFAYEKVLGKRWQSYSVMPSISVKRRELGDPVPGLSGALRDEVRAEQLEKGDVLFFLLEGYNLDADPALVERDGRQLGVWHTGLVHDVSGSVVHVIHARPGQQVMIEPLERLSFDALYVLRLPFKQLPRRSGGSPSPGGSASGSK